MIHRLHTRLGDELDWQPFDIPGGSVPVAMAVLRDDRARRCRTLAVRFPAGFRRPGPGWYEAAEELVVIEGELRMSGHTYEPGAWGYVPAEATRVETETDRDTLVVARFDGRPAWHEGPGNGAAHLQARLHAGPTAVLRRGERDRTGTGTPESGRAESETEILDLAARTFGVVAAGDALPVTTGPCFWRIVEREEETVR